MENVYVKTTLRQFEEKRYLYEKFCVAIYKILKNTLEDGGYKHQILYRIKEPHKLEEKLLRKKKEGKIYKSLDEIEDLAGLRIIFYLEGDIPKFINEIRKEFGGEKKIEEIKKKGGYNATHVVISLGPKRLSMDEYKKFENLKCEIQLTSILHHAWAEIEHDLVYKYGENGNQMNQKEYRTVRKKLKDVLKKYINKAAFELENITKKFRKKR
ncbi:MAG: RelA/SpoT domain-containing protein [Patescibacteria group bacterium]